MQVIDFLKKDQAVTAFIAKTSRIKNSLLTGVERGAFAVLIQAYLAQVGQPLLLIEENEYKAQERYNDLSRLLADDDLGLFALDGNLATQTAVSSPDELSSRIQCLNLLLSGRPGVVIATPQGLQYPLSAPALFKKGQKHFVVGDEIALPDLAQWLNQAGYHRENLVVKPGEFAMRGDIVDLYPLDRESPLRLEFFGDEIDTIKTFDLTSQRSLEELPEATVPAASDHVFTAEDLDRRAGNWPATCQRKQPPAWKSPRKP